MNIYPISISRKSKPKAGYTGIDGAERIPAGLIGLKNKEFENSGNIQIGHIGGANEKVIRSVTSLNFEFCLFMENCKPNCLGLGASAIRFVIFHE